MWKKMIVIMFFFTGCATQQALIKETNSGYPEAIFPNSTIEEVKSKIIGGCADRGWFMQDTNGNQIVVSKKLEGKDAILASLAIGNSYSTTPERKVRFTIFQTGLDVRVMAQQWVETQMASGQIRKEELNSNNQKNAIQDFLFSMGGQ